MSDKLEVQVTAQRLIELETEVQKERERLSELVSQGNFNEYALCKFNIQTMESLMSMHAVELARFIVTCS